MNNTTHKLKEVTSSEMVQAGAETMQSAPTPDRLANRVMSQFSRRELFRRGGMGAALLLLLAGVEQGELPHNQAANAQVLGGDAPPYQPTSDTGKQQFPYYTDAPWDQPQYYETILAGRRQFPKTYQAADIDGDGRDELIARGPGGIHVSKYNPDTGQWVPMSEPQAIDGGKLWRDDYGWGQPQYYRTIQLADIDGDGHAELIGRGGNGIEVHKYDPSTKKWTWLTAGNSNSIWRDQDGWNQPQYYTTIQCADINGDGKDELIGRGGQGLEVYAYDPSQGANPWRYLGSPDVMSDPVGWNAPNRYATIQCARSVLPGGSGGSTHTRSYILGSDAAGGIHTTALSATNWGTSVVDDVFGDDMYNPEYYSTFQCADINGDGLDEIIVRNQDGISVHNGSHTRLPSPQDPNGGGKIWPDSAGWNQPHYYSTIQLADFDGDGQAELIGRGRNGIELYDYNASTLSWSSNLSFAGLQDPKAAWSDANHWDGVQHYSTIQSARVLLPNDRGYTGDGHHAQSVLLARGSLGIQTWRYDTTTHGWVQTSAKAPAFNTDQPDLHDAYVALYQSLRIGSRYSEVRSTYNNQTFNDDGTFKDWQEYLYPNFIGSYDQTIRPNCSAPLPAGIKQTAWNEVTWQIYWELQWVHNVYTWYGQDETGALIGMKGFTDLITLESVGSRLSISSDSSLDMVFNILALLAGAAAAILTGGAALAPEMAALGVLSGIAGGMASTCSFIPSVLPGAGGAYTQKYNQLRDDIETVFNTALTNNGTLLFNLTGGQSDGNYSPSDYGRLKQIGEWLQDGTWSWIDGPHGSPASILVHLAARGYATYCWKALLAAQPWYAWNIAYYGDYPKEFIYKLDDQPNREVGWFLNRWRHEQEFVLPETLADLFHNPVSGATFPLGIPMSDVFEGKNGWTVSGYSAVSAVGATPPQAPSPSLGVDIRSAVALSRDATTGEIMVTVTLNNQGMTPATNVEITGATLGTRSLLGNHAQRQTRLFTGQENAIVLHFASLPAGTTVVLRVTGKYQGGTFGGSFRVKIP